MRTKMLAACVLAAMSLAVISCNWFGKKKHFISENTLVGKWVIDSIAHNSVIDDPIVGLVFSKPAFDDSLPVIVEFNRDSIYTMRKTNSDTIGTDKYYFDSSTQTLFAKEASSFHSFSVRASSDSSIQVHFLKDSIYYYLKKQP